MLSVTQDLIGLPILFLSEESIGFVLMLAHVCFRNRSIDVGMARF